MECLASNAFFNRRTNVLGFGQESCWCYRCLVLSVQECMPSRAFASFEPSSSSIENIPDPRAPLPARSLPTSFLRLTTYIRAWPFRAFLCGILHSTTTPTTTTTLITTTISTIAPVWSVLGRAGGGVPEYHGTPRGGQVQESPTLQREVQGEESEYKPGRIYAVDVRVVSRTLDRF